MNNNSDRNKETIQLLIENGCKLGMTTDVDLADLSNHGDDAIFNLPPAGYQ